MNDDYCVRMVNLPGDVYGVVRLSEDGFYNVYINDNLSPSERRKTLDHELRHIANDDFYSDKPLKEIEQNAEG